jgi:hypothetical protein
VSTQKDQFGKERVFPNSIRNVSTQKDQFGKERVFPNWSFIAREGEKERRS